MRGAAVLRRGAFALVVAALAVGSAVHEARTIQVRPLVRSVRLDGGKLFGLATSRSGSSVGVPFEVPVRIEPGSFSWYDKANEGDELLAEGLTTKAMNAYEAVLSMESLPKQHEPAVLLSMARTLAAQHRAFEAKKVVAVALQRLARGRAASTAGGLEVSLWFHLGLYNMMCGEWAGAERALREALGIEPDHGDSLNQLAILALVRGDLDGFAEFFYKFVQARSRVAAKRRQQVLLDSRAHSSYRSSFRKANLAEDMAVWLVDHVMLAFEPDSAPTLLQRAWIQIAIEAEEPGPGSARWAPPLGYRPGELEANLLLIYGAWEAARVGGGRDAGRAGHGFDLQLIHFNLGKRLMQLGAWREARLHFDAAAAAANPSPRSALLRLRALLAHGPASDESARGAAEGALGGEDCAEAESGIAKTDPKTACQQCAWLSADALERRSSSVLSPSKALRSTVARHCGGYGHLAAGLADAADQSEDDADTRVSRQQICVVAPQVVNSTAGKLAAQTVSSLGMLGYAVNLHLFSWTPRGGQGRGVRKYIFDPALVVELDPAAEVEAWRAAVAKAKCSTAILLDPMLDLRAVLLGLSRLAKRQVVIQAKTAHRDEGTMAEGDLVRLAPGTAQGAFVRAVWFRDVLADAEVLASAALRLPSPEVQGQYFFESERYYLLGGAVRDAGPAAQEFVEAVHRADLAGVVVVVAEAESHIETQRWLSQLSARRGVDLARIKVLERMRRAKWLEVLRNIDVLVALERGPSIVDVLEALALDVAVIAQEGPLSAGEAVLRGLGQGGGQFVSSGGADDLAQRASALAARGTPERRSFVASLALWRRGSGSIAVQELAEAWRAFLGVDAWN